MDASQVPSPDGLQAPSREGTPAPDFGLHTAPDQIVCLRDFRGQPVVLVFYPADWDPVSTEQLAYYQELLPEFQRLGAALVGISVDGVWCHRAFARTLQLEFPLLADFEPKGTVARAYGVYHARAGTAERALFLLDEKAAIYWSYRAPMAVDPGVDGILTALETLRAERDRST